MRRLRRSRSGRSARRSSCRWRLRPRTPATAGANCCSDRLELRLRRLGAAPQGRPVVGSRPAAVQDKADRAVRIFDKLCVPDIEGQPPFAIAAGEWFRDIVRVVFGSLDDEGVRHVPEVFVLVGKKNSKTTSGAGLMVTALLMNEVPWAEFLFIGPTQEIADLAFQQAAGMVEADPDGYLAKRFHVVDHKKTIRDRRNKAFVKVKTFDMKVMTGSKPIGVLIDELHVMGSIHYAARVVGQIRGALELKKNSFLLIITTQSDEPPAGVFRADSTRAASGRDASPPSPRSRRVSGVDEWSDRCRARRNRSRWRA